MEFVFDAPRVAGSRIQPRRTGHQARDVVADFAFAFAVELGYSCDLRLRVPASVAEPVGPIFEPIFDDASFGYRRGRSPKDALRKVWGEIQAGAEWIVDANLRDFFDTINHEWLMKFVGHRADDPRILRLIR